MYLLSFLRKRINAKNELCDFSCEIFSMIFCLFYFASRLIDFYIQVCFYELKYLLFNIYILVLFTMTKTDITENKLDTLILFLCVQYLVDARSDKLINMLARTILSASKVIFRRFQ